MAEEKVRIAVVHDQTVIRRGFVDLISSWARPHTILEAANGLAYEKACANVPRIHLALVDLHLPVRNGFQTIQWIDREQPRTKTIACCSNPTVVEIKQVLVVGAKGIVCTRICCEEMHRALEDVYSRSFHFNHYVDKALRQQVDDELPTKGVHGLTKRELQFLLLYARRPFHSLAQAAKQMKLSESGVESLRKLVAKRTGCRERHDMVLYVVENGLG
ncbi:MAG: response regulator [Flavobacteriales bacterium]